MPLKPLLVALALVGLIVLIAGQPANKDTPLTPQAKELAQNLQPVRAQEVLNIIRDQRGKPVMVFLYASWCPYCREAMGYIQALQEDGALAPVSLVFVSLDTDHYALASYLTSLNQDIDFKPCILKRGGTASPIDQLRAGGLNFDGSIPYLAYFNRLGEKVAESAGNVDKAQISAHINQAVN